MRRGKRACPSYVPHEFGIIYKEEYNFFFEKLAGAPHCHLRRSGV